MKKKSKVLLRQANPKGENRKSAKLLKREVTTDSLKEMKNEWHARVKRFVLNKHNQEGKFPPTVFFLVKEGNRTREYSRPYPLNDDNDMSLTIEMIREECGKYDVIAYCGAFGSHSLEIDEMGNENLPDKENNITMLCESRKEMVYSVFIFKNEEIVFESEERDHANSNEKSNGGLCNLLYLSDESLITQN